MSAIKEYPNFLAWPYVRLSDALCAEYDKAPIPGMCQTQAGLGLLKASQEFYRLTLETSEKMPIHCDYPMAITTAILYLNEPERCYGGTAFWKHRRTGYKGMPNQFEGNTAIIAELAKDANNPTKWDVYYTSEMEFNKLIVFDSRLFHSPYQANWGYDLDTGRIIQSWWLPQSLTEVTKELESVR